ncbi:zinc finger protein 34-like [Salarias fasciatus]|uniref:zinc finger protein 34-like n=1 Tax=Salarias fasciatus TaxID=181472 RepID=UPI00117699DE|nr:zinc finger protein 34-like [Salarias fasciatus]
MTSVQVLREFINQRLTAAAGEIFTVFQQTIVQYEEEIDRQRRLLEISYQPRIKLHRAEFPQHHDHSEEQPFKQETNDCGDQEEPESPQIKEEPEEPGLLQFKEKQEEPEPPQIEEHEELGTSREGEQFLLKFESETFSEASGEDQTDLSEPEELPDTQQILSQDSKVHHMKKCHASDLTINSELEKTSIFYSDRVENFPVLKKQDECEKILFETTVRTKHNLCQKLKTVTDDKNKVCEICDKRFNQKNTLIVHMRTHTGEKPYSCKTCGKRFSDQSSFLRHIKIHTGEKSYICETCGKRFNDRSNWLRHMRIHTGEKPYSCETCGKNFNQRTSLSSHMRTHTGGDLDFR